MINYAVSWIGIIVATIVSFIFGFLWYGPIFGKTWMSLMKFTEKDMKKAKEKGMGKNYFAMLISTLVVVYILGIVVNFAGSVSEVILLTVLLWLGFVATTSLSQVLWEGKSMQLYIFNNAFSVINYVIIALILFYL